MHFLLRVRIFSDKNDEILELCALSAVVARGQGQPGHVPLLERVVPRWTKCAKINEVDSKIKRRATVKLQCRRTTSQYQCDDTVLSTVTMIVRTHQLYTVVTTRLQVAESSRTFTSLLVLCLQEAGYKQQRFAQCSGR